MVNGPIDVLGSREYVSGSPSIPCIGSTSESAARLEPSIVPLELNGIHITDLPFSHLGGRGDFGPRGG